MKKKNPQAVFINRHKSTWQFPPISWDRANLSGLKIGKTSLLVLILLVAGMVLLAFHSSSTKIIHKNKHLLVEIPQQPVSHLIAQTELNAEIQWQPISVQKGQSLSSIFKDLGLSQTLLYNIIQLNKDTKQLTKIFPGAVVAFVLSEAGEFSQLKYNISETEELLVKMDATENQLSTEIISHPTENHIQTVNGIITGSFFQAGINSGLSDAMVMQLANIFAWDIDFVLDIRKGDSFSLIYEKIYQHGEFLRDGNIIAAAFTNQGETYQAIAYDDGNGVSFYNPQGRNMKKAFLRAPLNFSYISSNFNPKRLHPILKTVKAHRGIDYSAPKGTPVFAAGDGVVTRSAYDKNNGNHVFIQHPSGIVTKYLHFSKRTVKNGQKVKQGQTIGTVGATGLASGPHLHYEFVLNGVHRNPRTVQLPKASPLAENKMQDFLGYSSSILSQLDSLKVDKLAIEQYLDHKKDGKKES